MVDRRQIFMPRQVSKLARSIILYFIMRVIQPNSTGKSAATVPRECCESAATAPVKFGCMIINRVSNHKFKLAQILQILTMKIIPEWSAVRSNALVPINFKTNSLQIRTDEENSSKRNRIALLFVQDPEKPIKSIGISIDLKTDPPGYTVLGCQHIGRQFLKKLPKGNPKIWSIHFNTFGGLGVRILCNGKEMVDIKLSDETCVDRRWRENYSENVGFVLFHGQDTASGYFRRGDREFFFSINVFLYRTWLHLNIIGHGYT